MYVCMHVCMYSHELTFTRMCVYLRTRVYIRISRLHSELTFIHVYSTNSLSHIYIFMYVFAWSYFCVQLYMYVNLLLCVCTNWMFCRSRGRVLGLEVCANSRCLDTFMCTHTNSPSCTWIYVYTLTSMLCARTGFYVAEVGRWAWKCAQTHNGWTHVRIVLILRVLFTLKVTATHCSTLHHTTSHCSTLQRTAAHCSTL